MRSTILLIILCLALTMVFAVSADAQNPTPPLQERNAAEEQPIYDKLSAIDPAAVPIFQQATADMDHNNLDGAKRGFVQVLKLAPEFPDALRRLSYVEVKQGNVDAGIQHARRALAAEDAPYNHQALAKALLANGDSARAGDALYHARVVVTALPNDVESNLVLLQAGASAEDIEAIRQADTTLLRLAPELPIVHYFAGLLAADENRWETAERELLLARDMGIPDEDVQEVLDAGIRANAMFFRWERRALLAIGAWLIGLLLLFSTGLLLSRVTLKAVNRAQREGTSEPSAAERRVRSIYRAVITLTSIYFYLSIPFLILVVVEITGAIFYAFFALGQIPVRVILIVATIAFYTLYAIVRGLFTRVKDEEPGRYLPREEAPQLWSLTEEVAQRVGTRPVDAIYVAAGAEIAVTERGGFWKKLRGSGQRCLILGLGDLPGLPLSQFKAILAHEYGHFSNRDTAGGNLAGQVVASLHHMAYRLASSGQARWYNPAWLFINGYYRIYLRITLGASRLQEILADRFAAMAYGTRNFVDGLTYVVRQSLLFDKQITLEVQHAAQHRRALHNLYTLPPLDPGPYAEELDSELEKVLNRPTSPYDSHPALQDRIRFLQRFDDSGSASEGGQESVWSLIPNADELQAEMTRMVQVNVEQKYGLTLKAESEESDRTEL